MDPIDNSFSGESPVLIGDRYQRLPVQEERQMRVTCAWCGQLIEDGPGPVSHGMCPKCRAAFLAMIPEA